MDQAVVSRSFGFNQAARVHSGRLLVCSTDKPQHQGSKTANQEPGTIASKVSNRSLKQILLPMSLALLRLWLSQFLDQRDQHLSTKMCHLRRLDQRDQNLSTKMCHLRRLRLAYLISLKALVALTIINY
jgi:hypothetical protein